MTFRLQPFRQSPSKMFLQSSIAEISMKLRSLTAMAVPTVSTHSTTLDLHVEAQTSPACLGRAESARCFEKRPAIVGYAPLAAPPAERCSLGRPHRQSASLEQPSELSEAAIQCGLAVNFCMQTFRLIQCSSVFVVCRCKRVKRVTFIGQRDRERAGLKAEGAQRKASMAICRRPLGCLSHYEHQLE